MPVIGYFPEALEDELFHSTVSRYHELMKNVFKSYTLKRKRIVTVAKIDDLLEGQIPWL